MCEPGSDERKRIEAEAAQQERERLRDRFTTAALALGWSSDMLDAILVILADPEPAP